MKIVCPTCEATYEVPETVLASKRQVRCARCGNDWVPGADWQPPHGEASGADAPLPASGIHDQALDGVTSPMPAPHTELKPEPAIAASQSHPEWDEPAGADLVAQTPMAAPLPPEPAVRPPYVAVPTATPEAVLTRTPVAGWIISGAVLAALIVGAVVFRGPVMKAWPPSTRVYAALGLPS